jgi:hypothetical protein
MKMWQKIHGLKDFMPRGPLQWISALILLGIFCAYASYWIHNNRVVFTDTMLHDDDVRIHVMPMHRYDGKGTLKDDPVALDMLAFATPGFRLLHMVSVPIAGLRAAPKVTIVVCYLLLVVAMVIALRSKKAGLASAALLGFLFLHTDQITRSMTSGVQRGFAFPVMAIWIAGVLANSRLARFSAIVLGALTYPTAMVVIVAAEGLLLMKNGIRLKCRKFSLKVRAYVIVVAACLAVIQMDAFLKPDVGRLPTLEEAAANPAFGQDGRLTELPFRSPQKDAQNVMDGFFARGKGHEFWAGYSGYAALESTGPMLCFSLLIILCLARLSPKPMPAVALGCGCMILYLLARVFAFKLYIPNRYLLYGIMGSGLMLIVYAIGLIGDRIENPHTRSTVRNLAVTAFIGVLIFLTGDHLKACAAINVDGHVHEPVWSFITELPGNTKIAAHPRDADGISFWTGKPATPGIEHTMPWHDKAWKRNKAKMEDSLRLVYAITREDVLAICEREDITHILTNARMYSHNFRERAETFEPLTSFALELLDGVELSDLVLADPPAEAIAIEHYEYRLIDVEKLRHAWHVVDTNHPASRPGGPEDTEERKD